MDYRLLEENLMDLIEEEQIKLGYREETIRFYYPAQSINHLLGTSLTSEDLLKALKAYKEESKGHLGDVTFSRKGDRFCVQIPGEGVTYVHNVRKGPSFLSDFIGLVTNHQSTLEEIKTVFARYNRNYMCVKVEDGEFDYVLSFPDGTPDEYFYCIKYEGPHVTYHRFTPLDYKDFGF